MGFEPTTFGTTIRHSNQLSYIHHIIRFRIGDKSNTDFCYIQISKAVFRKISQKSELHPPHLHFNATQIFEKLDYLRKHCSLYIVSVWMGSINNVRSVFSIVDSSRFCKLLRGTATAINLFCHLYISSHPFNIYNFVQLASHNKDWFWLSFICIFTQPTRT